MTHQQTTRSIWFISSGFFALILLGTLLFAPPAQAQDSPSILSNGKVKLGVNPEANLGVSGSTAPSGEGTTDVGLRLSSTNNDGISPGGSQEGWGIADVGTGTTGFVSGNPDYGKSNVIVSSFNATSDTATSVVDVGAAGGEVSFQVTHEFKVSSASDNLFVAEVAVENTGNQVADDLRYRRVVDWDTEPTAFDELVTIDGEKTPYLLFSSNEGFASPDPLGGKESYGASGFFKDHGPDDQGSLVDLKLGALKSGAQRTFKLYYGAASSQSAATSAIQSAGAQIYSFAEPYTGATEEGAPNTFIMAFSVPQQPPSARNDSATVDEDGEATLNVLENDTDPEGDSLAVSNSTQASNGQVNCAQGGQCTYTPEANFNGEDSFTYTASDGNGGTDQGKVTVTVKAVNDTPEAQADTYTTDEDNTLTVDVPGVLENDSDTDDDQLTAEAVGQPQNGTLTLDPNGSFTYEPEANFNGEDSFIYKACDDATTPACAEPVQVKITVSPVNDAPTAKDDSATTPGDVPKNIDVLANDTDAEGDTLTIQEFTQGSGGTVEKNPDRTLRYIPDDTFTGDDAFTYTVADGNGGTSKATVTVNVTPAVNDPPQSKDDTYTTKEDNDLTISAPGVLQNDTDPENDPLTAVEVEGPTNGTLTLVKDGSFTYKPDKDYNGTDTFTYKATDGQDPGNTSTAKINVDAVNDQPLANPDSSTTQRDNAVKIDVLSNDKDADGGQLTVSDSTQPANGQVDCTQAGECTYTPSSGFTGQDSFDYTAADGNGGTNTATVSVAVEEPPPPPETNITSGPEGLTNSATASFAFSSDRQEATFECKLDGAAFEDCSSPKEYASLTQGSHTFEVRAVDSLDQKDASPAKRIFTVDINAPTVNAPDERFLVPSQLGSPNIPVRITWSGSDDRSGLARYELQHSVDGEPFTTLDLPESLAQAITPNLKRGTHRFRIRAQDKAGNWSAYKAGPRFVLSSYQEGSSAVSYPSGSWIRQALNRAYGGYVRYETSEGSRARFNFTGKEAAWVTHKGPNRGKAEIYVDGTRVKVVDLYSANLKARQIVFKRAWASSGSHKVVVKVLGKKNASSKNTRVGVDAFVSIY